jgi:ABC-type lipoprotein release transport system permease subunit
MPFYLAVRNIVRNKKNSAVVALLIAVITFLFFIGNSVIGRADESMRRAFAESLTGDVVLQKAGGVTMNLFGANVPVIDEFFTVPALPAYDAVREIAASSPGAAGLTAQVSGRAVLDALGTREAVLLCGVDAETYFSLFPGIAVEEGRALDAGEYGAMITAERADRIQAAAGARPKIGDALLLTSGGGAGFKIREVPLAGIFRYQNPGQFMNEIVIADAQTVRVLNSIQVAGASAETDEETLNLLAADVDSLFGGDFSSDAEETEGGDFSADALRSILGETPDAPETGGDWNFIIVRLDKGVSASAFIARLNKKLGAFGVTAVNWRTAAGMSAILILLVQTLFNAGLFLVSVAGVIAVINILLISVFRRGREIGTLRAIGASDGYVRRLVLTENLLLALAAGGAGVLAGNAALAWLNGMNLAIPNALIASLLGGSVFRVDFFPAAALRSVAAAGALGFAASLYPVETAVRIEPMAAVRRG